MKLSTMFRVHLACITLCLFAIVVALWRERPHLAVMPGLLIVASFVLMTLIRAIGKE